MTFPEPLVGIDVDCSDLDGFMLNVERLMASELVALSSHEVVAAALFLWCRAWKQRPAASLPDDDRINASFARLPLAKFKKVKDEVLRGFIKCSDGRLYHRVLAVEATGAFERKKAFQTRRKKDAERLKKWRSSQEETHVETDDETRFVAEGQGQGQGQGLINSETKVSGASPPADPKAELFRESAWLAEMTQRSAADMRSMIGKWLRDLGGDRHVGLLLGIIQDTRRSQQAAPVEWISKIVSGRRAPKGSIASNDSGPKIDAVTGKKWAQTA